MGSRRRFFQRIFFFYSQKEKDSLRESPSKPPIENLLAFLIPNPFAFQVTIKKDESILIYKELAQEGSLKG